MGAKLASDTLEYNKWKMEKMKKKVSKKLVKCVKVNKIHSNKASTWIAWKFSNLEESEVAKDIEEAMMPIED